LSALVTFFACREKRKKMNKKSNSKQPRKNTKGSPPTRKSSLEAKDSELNTNYTESLSSTDDAALKEDDKVEAKLPEQLRTPQRAAVDALFQTDADLRQAITENLKTLRAESDTVAKRVQEAFATFNPSNLSTEELARRHYVAPGADPGEVQETVIMSGVDALRSSETEHTITVRYSAELKKLIKEAPESGDSLHGVAELGPLFEFIQRRGAGPFLGAEPTSTPYRAEAKAEAILDAVGNGDRGGDGDHAARREAFSSDTREAEELVKNTVNLQMKSATAPESQLAYGKIPNSADEDKVQSNILQTFELRPGPTDVTSYHDFHTLQIAFAHVWTEIFDGQLATLGRDLYSEYVKLKDFSGSTQPDLQVGTLADLRRLMEEVKKLSQIVEDDIPPSLRTEAVDQAGNSGLKPEDVLRGVAAVATLGLSEVAMLVLKEISNAGKKPSLNWSQIDSRGLPLPSGYGTIIATFSNNAPSGYVQMQLATGQSTLRIMEFQPWSSSQGRFINHMNGNDRDNLVSNADNPNYTSRLITLPASAVGSGVIEFASEQSPGYNLGRYVLAGLEEKLTSGWRVTFTWTD
jgi:hypothetical protein